MVVRRRRHEPSATARRILTGLAKALVAIAALELCAWGLDSAIGFSARVLPAMEPSRTVSGSTLCQAQGLVANCEDLRKDLAKDIDRILSLCSDDKAEYEIVRRWTRSDSTLRVLVLGGSSVFHYDSLHSREMPCADGMVGRIDAHLATLLPSGAVEVINGSELGLTSGDLVGLISHLPEGLGPDIVFIYTGVNEFVGWTYPALQQDSPAIPLRAAARRSHLYRLILFGIRSLMRGVARDGAFQGYVSHTIREDEGGRCLRHRFCDPDLFQPRDWEPIKTAVTEQLQRNLRYIVRRARGLGADVVVATVATNPRLPPCFGSRQPTTVGLTDSEQIAALETLLHEGEAELADHRPGDALMRFDRAAVRDPRAPLGHWGRARALEAMGEHEEALHAFWMARENAIGDFGSILTLNETIREVARSEAVPLIDAHEAFLQYHRDAGEPPYNQRLLYDECHPNRDGNDLIARLFADKVVSEGFVQPFDSTPEP